MAYAERTAVTVEQSRAEIETLLQRHGCDAVATMWDNQTNRAMIQFRAHERYVRFTLTLPDEQDYAITEHKRQHRSPAERKRLHQQGLRQRWRALLLCIRAKIEAVETGIETWEEAFMPQIVMPDSRTVSDLVLPAVARAYDDGKMPNMTLLLLPAAPGDS